MSLPIDDTAKINMLSRIARYHEDASVFRKAFAHVGGLIKAGKFPLAFLVINHFSKINIDDHFDFEEQSVFTLIESHFNTHIMLVSEFKKAHAIIRSLNQFILDGINSATETSALDDNTLGKVAKLFLILEQHAKRETETIVPLFTNNQSVNFLLRRSVVNTGINKTTTGQSTPISTAIADEPDARDSALQITQLPPSIHRISPKEFVSEIDGYKIVIESQDTVKYIQNDKSIHCLFKPDVSGQKIADSRAITQ